MRERTARLPPGAAYGKRPDCRLAVAAILSLVVCDARHGWAEPVGERCAPAVAAAHARMSSTDFALPAPGGEVEAAEWRLAACLVAFGTIDNGIELGLDYQYTRYEYTGVAGRNRDLHRLAVPVGFVSTRDGWRLAGHLAPAIATSSNVFKDIGGRAGGRDFRLDARIETEFGRAPAGRWLIGAVFDTAFGESRLYPVVGLAGEPGPRSRLRLAWPDPAFEFAPTPRHALSARLAPAGQRWHVVSDELGADFDYEVRGLRLELAWSYRLYANLTVDLLAGFETDREHRLTDDAGNRIRAEAGDQWLVGLGFRLGPAPLPSAHGRRLPPPWR